MFNKVAKVTLVQAWRAWIESIVNECQRWNAVRFLARSVPMELVLHVRALIQSSNNAIKVVVATGNLDEHIKVQEPTQMTPGFLDDDAMARTQIEIQRIRIAVIHNATDRLQCRVHCRDVPTLARRELQRNV